MAEFLAENQWVTIAVILGVAFLVIIIILSFWKKVPQDKAMIVTGLKKRVISGGGGFVIPVLERTDKISLENMKIEVRIGGAMASQGVPISADGVAVIKIKSDKESILAAMEQFNRGSESRTIAVIEEISRYVLEGKLREIISKLTVEEIYRDREKFASEVQGTAAQDLSEMGLEIKAFTIRDISDENGYLAALGKKRISEVKRDAQIAEAEAAKETKIRTAEASRLGEEASLLAETQVAEAMKEKELKVQAFRKDQETSKAVADLAYEIESNKTQKEVTETQMQVEIIRKQKEIELAEQEVIRQEKELQATIMKQADAQKYRLEKEADVAKYKEIAVAEARADAIRMEGASLAESQRAQGMAEADIIRERGMAEAEAMMKKAEAFKQYNDAAVTQMIIERLPEIAKNVSEPLGRTEKIVVIDSAPGGQKGAGASKVSGYVTDIIATLPQTIEALTGIDIIDKLKNKYLPDDIEG